MSLPITKAQAIKLTKWMMSNFGTEIKSAVAGTLFEPEVIAAIACQETGYFTLSFLDKLTPAEVLARCVLDASGDYPGTHRSAFPRNTAAFRARYGNELTDMLIAEANATRKLRGFGPQRWVYKGWGIFQNDLQAIVDDEAFFRERQWHRFGPCAERVVTELKGKRARVGNDLWKILKAYNGSGPAATAYANNCQQFITYCREAGA